MRNSKAFKILAFIALFLLIMFAWIVWKDARDKKILNIPPNTGLENPFGGSSSENDLPSTGKDTSSNGSNNGQDVPPTPAPETPNVTIVETAPALRQLYDKPVAGFTFVTEDRIIPEPESATPTDGLVEVYDFSGYRTIRFGDKADEVVAIKTVLNRQTPSPALTINTEYDTDMKNAAVAFQNANGLPGDGVIGPKTYQKLNVLQGITSYTSTKKPDNVETVLMTRFVDVASGLISDRAIRKNEEKKSVTKTSVPRVVEAFFDSTGTNVVMRYLKGETIETYLGKLTFPKIDPNLTQEEKDKLPKTADISGEFLPENIKALSVSHDRKNLFYMAPATGGTIGLTYNFATKGKKQIFSTPLTEWIADFASDTKIGITTKASALVEGYAYTLDVKTGSMNKVIGKEKGLTTLMSPDGKKLLYAAFQGGTLRTFVYDMTKGTSNTISPTALPEKCVWTNDSKELYCLAPVRAMTGSLPDDWYQGSVSFDDALWNTELVSFNGNIVYDFATKSNQRLDGISPMLNAAQDYLLFKNKKDGTLWGYDLAK